MRQVSCFPAMPYNPGYVSYHISQKATFPHLKKALSQLEKSGQIQYKKLLEWGLEMDLRLLSSGFKDRLLSFLSG